MVNFYHEVYFWTEVMENHAEFILGALPAREAEIIAKAQYFRDTYGTVHSESRKYMQEACEIPAGYQDYLLKLLYDFINFKHTILKKQLTCCIEFNLPPSFTNHMINEAMEFVSVLSSANAWMQPVQKLMHQHIVWLTDAAGHAATIMADLDPTEATHIREANTYMTSFTQLRDKALELSTMLERTALSDGAVEELNTEVKNVMGGFICFLEKMKMLREACKVLGIFTPLVPDHMIREEVHYLAKVRDYQE
jgi:hypothetical protein